MSDNGITAMIYDRDRTGSNRLYSNAGKIEKAVNGKFSLKLDRVNRPVPFGSELNAHDIFIESDKMTYDAVIIIGTADHADEVLENAVLRFEEDKTPFDRLMYLHGGSLPDLAKDYDIKFIKIRGGNSHLTEGDSKEIAGALEEIAKSN